MFKLDDKHNFLLTDELSKRKYINQVFIGKLTVFKGLLLDGSESIWLSMKLSSVWNCLKNTKINRLVNRIGI